MTLGGSKETELLGHRAHWSGRLGDFCARKLADAVCFYCVQGNRTLCTFFVNKQVHIDHVLDPYHQFFALKKTTLQGNEY